jgi:archaellum biogenesis protein FlaJ (TadC family)
MSNEKPMTRGKALLIAVIGAAFLVINHWSATNEGKVYMWFVFMGPMFLLLGLGGLFEPRLAQAIGDKGRHFPAHIKFIGGILALSGLLISAYLALGVYRLQDGSMRSSHGSSSTPDQAP